ncbi:MAG: LD-carboxypeptidase [Lachnospiraceae bacterium]|nr:LD-carboxypeptidase [Lachnospiraceae bacterium]
MKYPKNLQKGGCIGFPAPSFGCSIEPYYTAFQNSLKKWEDLGYRTCPGPNAYAAEGVGISNTPQKCGQELTEMYLSKETQALISCGGGELMCEILDYIDFEAIREAEPKWYQGYSDNTNMTYLLATLCDTASIYGPCAAAFGMEPWHSSLKDAHGLLTGTQNSVQGYDLWEKESLKDAEHPLVPYHVTEPREIKAYYKGEFLNSPDRISEEIHMQGRLLGGCMDCLVNLLGTKFDKTVEFTTKYAEDGILWFLEACDLNVFSIRRAMWQMEHAGWFKHVKGFLIGRPLNGEAMFNLNAYEAVLAMASKYNVPVIMDLDIGHLAPMMPLVVGSLADVRVIGNDIEVKMEYK